MRNNWTILAYGLGHEVVASVGGVAGRVGDHGASDGCGHRGDEKIEEGDGRGDVAQDGSDSHHAHIGNCHLHHLGLSVHDELCYASVRLSDGAMTSYSMEHVAWKSDGRGGRKEKRAV